VLNLQTTTSEIGGAFLDFTLVSALAAASRGHLSGINRHAIEAVFWKPCPHSGHGSVARAIVRVGWSLLGCSRPRSSALTFDFPELKTADDARSPELTRI